MGKKDPRVDAYIAKSADFAKSMLMHLTDFATFAYVADVFILPEYRGRRLSVWLMQVMTQHPDLQGLRRWLLVTRDAGGLYRKCGFEPLSRPEQYMQRPGA